MFDLINQHKSWKQKMIGSVDTTRGWHRSLIHVSHDKGPKYEALLHHPSDWSWENSIRQLTKSHDDCPDGRWITVHPGGEETDGHPIYICPNTDGSYTVTRGAGGKLNGLRLTHVKSEEEYKQHASVMREQKLRQRRLTESARQSSMGKEAYARDQEERQGHREAARAAQTSAEKAFIRAVADAQGIHPASLEVPEEHLTNVDPKVAKRIIDQNHKTAVAWARRVTAKVKDIVMTAYDDLSQDAIGELGSKDISRDVLGDTGKGYRANMEQLATDHGLTNGETKAVTQDVAWRRFLDRSDGNIEEAARKRDASDMRQASAREAASEKKRVGEDLAEEGVGPQAVRQFSIQPNVQNMNQAVDILKAAKAMEHARQAAEDYNKQIDAVDLASRLPKAAVVIGRDIDDDKLVDAVAQTLSEEHMQRSMNKIIGTRNALEVSTGSLQEHTSVGQASALSEVMQSVDGTNVDPLALDILGASGIAAITAHRWKSNMSPQEFDAIGKALADHHIATQEKIAEQGFTDANAHLDAAEKIDDVSPVDPDSVEAAVIAHSQKLEHIRRAREAAGIASGRLEATAAINYAVMNANAKRALQVPLGTKSTADAVQDAFAIGLNDPSTYDHAGELTHQGDFTIHSDGQNRILEIHPSGIAKLAGKPDEDLQHRAMVTADIRNGKHDDPDWLPAGISRRPVTLFDTEPLERTRVDDALSIASGESKDEIAQKLRHHIGGRINSGQDPFDVQADVASAYFAKGLGLDENTENEFRSALAEVAPFNKINKGKLDTDAYSAKRDMCRKKLESYADEYLDNQVKSGKISADEQTLNKQRIASDDTARDCLYQSALRDPRTVHAFTKIGDLDREGREAIRSYANEKIFHIDPKSEEILTPTTSDEKSAYHSWAALKAEHGDPYAEIQRRMAEKASGDVGLFGDEPEIPAIAKVDLTNTLALIKLARENPKMLGYESLTRADGTKVCPELGEEWSASPDGVTSTKYATRTPETIASEVRGRVRQKLREHYMGDILGMHELAEQHFNPESVKTIGKTWSKYVQTMGGEKRALQTVQDFMAGDLVDRFSTAYSQATGKQMAIVDRDVANADNHATALIPEGQRQSGDPSKAERARVIQGASGKFERGGVKDKMELNQQAENETARLFGTSESGERRSKTTRATIGRTAEANLRMMMPSIDVSRPVEAAGDIRMSGKNINQQRATKLILENKRQGLGLGAGSGKTLCMTGAFAEARARGEANRALYLVPSNAVGQFGGEFAKFVDPASGLRWSADSTASGHERQQSYANNDLHMVVVTPEAFREDITKAVSEDNGWSPEETVDKMAKMEESDIDQLVHSAMDKRGWNFEFNAIDEGHRTLGRQGKPDSHMARICDSAGRKSKYYVYSSADPVKNDASEAWHLLHKIDPVRYGENGKAAFMRRYTRNTMAAGVALQREMQTYVFAASTDMGVDHGRTIHKLP
ncbi:MAG: DEAD/DEAH box helicase family protein, partial [Chthonomonadales bacterium]